MIANWHKPAVSRRIAAMILDFILLTIIATGAATLLSWAFGYDTHADIITARRQHFEQAYGIQFQITNEEYEALTKESQEAYNAAFEALTGDEAFLQAYNMQISLTMLIATFSVLAGVLVVEFVIPLFFKNGQTVGKKLFGIALMRTDGVQISTLQLFIRSILGKFTIEMMIPIYTFLMLFFNIANIITLVILGALLIVQLICLGATQTHNPIHDRLSGTVAVDFSTQMIFVSHADLLEYLEQSLNDEANSAEYF